MERDRSGRAAFADCRLGRLQLRPRGVERVADGREFRSAFGDCPHQAVDLCLRRLHPCLGPARVAGAFLCLLRRESVIFADEFADHRWVEQIPFQPRQHPRLEEVRLDRPPVVAVPAVAAVGAAPFFGADDGIASSANAAGRQPRQQPLRATLLRGADAVEAVAAGGDGRPCRIIDDSQLRRWHDRPVLRRGRPNAFLARVGVDRAAGAVEHQLPEVHRVLQDAVLADAIAIDRRRRPRSAAGAWDALGVQPLGDFAGGSVVEEFGEDSAHHLRFLLVNFAQPAHRLAIRAETNDAAIPVGLPARTAPREHTPGLPAPRLVGQVLAVESRHRSLEADVHLADLALGEGDEAHPGEFEAAEDVGDVGLVARQPVDRFGQHHVGLPIGDGRQQAVEARALPNGAADRVIGKGAGHGPALALRSFGADPQLVLNRGVLLQRGGETGVQQRAHGVRPGWRCR